MLMHEDNHLITPLVRCKVHALIDVRYVSEATFPTTHDDDVGVYANNIKPHACAYVGQPIRYLIFLSLCGYLQQV